jgi:hypothetical protein
MLTKAIIEKQEYIGLACQTGQAQARAKSRYALDEVSVGNLRAEGYGVWRQHSQGKKALPWWTKVNEVRQTRV